MSRRSHSPGRPPTDPGWALALARVVATALGVGRREPVGAPRGQSRRRYSVRRPSPADPVPRNRSRRRGPTGVVSVPTAGAAATGRPGVRGERAPVGPTDPGAAAGGRVMGADEGRLGGHTDPGVFFPTWCEHPQTRTAATDRGGSGGRGGAHGRRPGRACRCRRSWRRLAGSGREEFAGDRRRSGVVRAAGARWQVAGS